MRRPQLQGLTQGMQGAQGYMQPQMDAMQDAMGAMHGIGHHMQHMPDMAGLSCDPSSSDFRPRKKCMFRLN